MLVLVFWIDGAFVDAVVVDTFVVICCWLVIVGVSVGLCAGNLLQDTDVFDHTLTDPVSVEMTSMSERGSNSEQTSFIPAVVVPASASALIDSVGVAAVDPPDHTDRRQSALPLNPLFASLGARGSLSDQSGGDHSAKDDQGHPDRRSSWTATSVPLPTPTYERFDLDDGTPYFVHTVTQESVWELPQGAVLVSHDQ